MASQLHRHAQSAEQVAERSEKQTAEYKEMMANVRNKMRQIEPEKSQKAAEARQTSMEQNRVPRAELANATQTQSWYTMKMQKLHLELLQPANVQFTL